MTKAEEDAERAAELYSRSVRDAWSAVVRQRFERVPLRDPDDGNARFVERTGYAYLKA